MTDDPSTAAPKLPHLSDREKECLSYAAQGLSNKAIANRLNLSPRTVEQHMRNAAHHLGAANRTAAAVIATKLSLL